MSSYFRDCFFFLSYLRITYWYESNRHPSGSPLPTLLTSVPDQSETAFQFRLATRKLFVRGSFLALTRVMSSTPEVPFFPLTLWSPNSTVIRDPILYPAPLPLVVPCDLLSTLWSSLPWTPTTPGIRHWRLYSQPRVSLDLVSTSFQAPVSPRWTTGTQWKEMPFTSLSGWESLSLPCPLFYLPLTSVFVDKFHCRSISFRRWFHHRFPLSFYFFPNK